MADGATITGRVRRTPSVPTRGSLRRWFGRKSSVGFLMCLPLIVLIAALVIYPALYAIYLSMLNKKMTQFVGLSNYTFLLKRNTFQLVVFQSCFFAVSAVILKATLGFILAHLLHNISGGNQRIVRGMLLTPWVIPLALSTLGWQWLFELVLLRIQLGAERVWLRLRPVARRALDRAVLRDCSERVVRHTLLHDHVSRGAEIGARGAL